jgi:DNA (cytosine-5)-methyltransferase 1
MKPTIKSYFSGAGGMDIGLLESGCEIIQSLEYDPTAVETLKKNFNHKIVSKDIRDMRVLSQEESDVIVGTYPCTKYSTIADIHGTRTGDDLFLHFFRHMAIEQPECFVVENVPGIIIKLLMSFRARN